ncbi:hypothetical protein [Pleionea litopenaei]|uniref:Uncharacterized protein n=1 Tax=Pleionea litopenaei TaxID=3070815 RepID=A0AA51RTP1_9GAMM|nr:hypothetical protein [Pleionea sp. HL-JVS1]WMS87392.1 hypothetical protein Q9312_00330 [Pleionea sp. HL-JVS1]
MKGKYSKIIQEYCEAEAIYVPPGFKRRPASHLAVVRTDDDHPKLVAKTFFKKEDLNYYISSILSELQPNPEGELPVRVIDFKENTHFKVAGNGALIPL